MHPIVFFACNNVNIVLLIWRPLFFVFASFVSNVGFLGLLVEVSVTELVGKLALFVGCLTRFFKF